MKLQAKPCRATQDRQVMVESCQFIEKMTELDPFNIVNKWK